MAQYSDFTSGDFSLNDVISASPQGFSPSDYQALGRTFGFSDEEGAPGQYGLWDNLSPTNPGIRLYNGTCLLPFGLMSGTTATTITGSIQVMDR